MFDDKEILGAISTRFNQKRDKYTEKDKVIAEAEAHIAAMMEFDMIDKNKLQDHFNDIVTETSELAYFMGLQEGAKLIHILISGNCVDEIMKTWGAYLEDVHLLKANVRAPYSNTSKGIKNYWE